MGVHPAFAAHFTDQVYVEGAGDRLPFGTDEGADMLHDWLARAEELVEYPTLRFALTGDPDDAAEFTPPRHPVDEDDEELIAAGFALLLITGNIDDEGRRWLRAALRRRLDQYDDSECRTMLVDLESFRPATPPPAPAPPGRQERLVSGRWLTIDVGVLQAGSDGSWRRWVKRHSQDERWINWWRESGFRRLALFVHPIDVFEFETDGQVATLVSSTSELVEYWKRLMTTARSHEDVLTAVALPSTQHLLGDALNAQMRTVADRLSLQRPPYDLVL